jgi:hypothetical protein
VRSDWHRCCCCGGGSCACERFDEAFVRSFDYLPYRSQGIELFVQYWPSVLSDARHETLTLALPLHLSVPPKPRRWILVLHSYQSCNSLCISSTTSSVQSSTAQCSTVRETKTIVHHLKILVDQQQGQSRIKYTTVYKVYNGVQSVQSV